MRKLTLLSLSTLIFCANANADLSVSFENHFYNWKSQTGQKGSQHVMPFNLAYQNGAFNFGLRRAYIRSANKSPELYGRLSHWSDTSMSFAYTAFQEKALPVRFNLSTNIPNGKATLSGNEKNAVMDSNLVWQTRFGEGFNITPGINIAYALTEKDTIGFGISRIFRGSFDPNGDVENDKIKQGADTIATFQYARTGERGQIQFNFTQQHSGVTKRDNKAYYKKGRLRTFDVNSHFALTDNQVIYGGYSYAYRQKDKYINNLTGNLDIEQFNSNGSTHWLNAGYSYYLGKHTFGGVVEYLKINSNSYDHVNALFVPKRVKKTAGLNYQYRWTKQFTIDLSAKRFKMKDNATPYMEKQHYRGWNLVSNVKYDF